MQKQKEGEISFIALLKWVLACELIGILGSTVTIAEIPTWYAGLIRPPFNPPSWVFGPVWTTLYALMGVAAYRISRVKKKRRLVKGALGLFAMQLFLNCIWSFLFFGKHDIPLAFVDIALLWIVLIVLVVKFEKLDTIAGYLMVPYVFWVSFALILNYAFWILNP